MDNHYRNRTAKSRRVTTEISLYQRQLYCLRGKRSSWDLGGLKRKFCFLGAGESPGCSSRESGGAGGYILPIGQ